MKKNLAKFGIFRRRTAALLFIAAAFIASAIFANSIDEEIKRKELEKEEIRRAIETMEQTLREKTNILEEINIKIFQTTETIRKLEEEIEALDLDIQNTEVDIQVKESEIGVADKNLRETTELLYKRLRVMYKSGTVGYLEVLFGADSMQELLSRADILQRIVEKDQELISKLERHREILSVKKKDLEEKEAHLKELRDQRIAKVKEQQEKIQDLYAYYQQVEQDRIAFEEQVRIKQIEEEEITNLIEKLELSKIAYAGGNMAWPVPSSYEVSSPFGPRPELVAFGAAYFHGGMDIAAPTGDAIVSAQSGTVMTATYLSGYGNTVIIDHGGGIVTLYGHMNAIHVQPGDEVQIGEQIGTIGSTGLSTGPHLHFEVREDGERIDPMNYIGFYLE